MDPNNDSASSFQYQQVLGSNVKKQSAAYHHSALHSVRKISARSVITKRPVQAPLPPTHPRIYKVKPVDFRDVVQRLTGAVDIQSTRLREAAPPPLSLSPPDAGKAGGVFSARNEDCKKRKSVESGFGPSNSPIGFSLSPSSLAWCSSMLLSPGTVSSFEPSAAL